MNNKFKGLKVDEIKYFSYDSYEGVIITWSGNRGKRLKDKEVYEFGEYTLLYDKESKSYSGDSERMDFDSKEFLQYLLNQIEIKEDSIEKGIQFLIKMRDNFDKIKVNN